MAASASRRLGALAGGAVRALLARNPVILVPLGSFEDQGPHAPMGDYLCAERVAELIADRASSLGAETYVAPVLPYGADDIFGSSPGGAVLSQTTYRAVLRDLFDSLLRHGTTRFIVINGHGGNTQPVHDVTKEIHRTRGVLIPSMYIWRIAHTLLPSVVGEEIGARSFGHGADPLTSIVMHLMPDLHRADLVAAPRAPRDVMGLPMASLVTVGFKGAEIHVPVEYHASVPDGVWHGDPRLASAETGRAITERLVGIGADFVVHYAGHGGAPAPARL